VPLAAAVKKASGIAVEAVGMIVSPHQAEAIIAGNRADFVALARGFLGDPRWGWHAAAALGAKAISPAVASGASSTLAGCGAGTCPTARGIKQQGVAWRNGCADPTISGRRAVGAAAARSKRPRRRARARPPRCRARYAFEANEFELMGADRLENCPGGASENRAAWWTSHIAGIRAGYDHRPIVRQADFAFECRQASSIKGRKLADAAASGS
jgi:hypothetical protein